MTDDVVTKTKLVHIIPNQSKCDFSPQILVQTVAEVFGAAIVDSLPKDRPKDQVALIMTAACGLTQSTFYYRSVSFEVWVNYCDPAAGPVCLAQTVFGFTHSPSVDEWSCAKGIIRQELLNDKQRDVMRVLGKNCQ